MQNKAKEIGKAKISCVQPAMNEKKDKKVNLIIENLLMQLFFSNIKYTIDNMAGQR